MCFAFVIKPLTWRYRLVRVWTAKIPINQARTASEEFYNVMFCCSAKGIWKESLLSGCLHLLYDQWLRTIQKSSAENARETVSLAFLLLCSATAVVYCIINLLHNQSIYPYLPFFCTTMKLKSNYMPCFSFMTFLLLRLDLVLGRESKRGCRVRARVSVLLAYINLYVSN